MLKFHLFNRDQNLLILKLSVSCTLFFLSNTKFWNCKNYSCNSQITKAVLPACQFVATTTNVHVPNCIFLTSRNIWSLSKIWKNSSYQLRMKFLLNFIWDICLKRCSTFFQGKARARWKWYKFENRNRIEVLEHEDPGIGIRFLFHVSLLIRSIYVRLKQTNPSSEWFNNGRKYTKIRFPLSISAGQHWSLVYRKSSYKSCIIFFTLTHAPAVSDVNCRLFMGLHDKPVSVWIRWEVELF